MMKTLFGMPDSDPKALPKYGGKRCRDCRYIANLNTWSTNYWYCTITPSSRTSYGVKPVKRMNIACVRFEGREKK